MTANYTDLENFRLDETVELTPPRQEDWLEKVRQLRADDATPGPANKGPVRVREGRDTDFAIVYPDWLIADASK